MSSFYIVFVSVHSPIRKNLKVDVGTHDIGGSTRAVMELAMNLAEHDFVGKLDLVVRRVDEQSPTEEKVNDKLTIIRIPAGPAEYVYKKKLWPLLDTFNQHLTQFYVKKNQFPTVVHSHHAVSVYPGFKLARILNATFIYTPHSLGHMREKCEKSESSVKTADQYRKRIAAEEFGLEKASLVLTCSKQEISNQYREYVNFDGRKFVSLSPGVDFGRLCPEIVSFKDENLVTQTKLRPFLRDLNKPMILSIARAEVSKNQKSLVQVFGKSERLREMANLILIAGCRDDLYQEGDGVKKIITELLVEIDRHDLYGSVAYPKNHTQEEVATFFALAAKSKGVFVNIAFTELFGLTFLEASAFGLPIVATNNGGAVEILKECQNGVTVSPTNHVDIEEAIYSMLTAPNYVWKEWSKNGYNNVRKAYSWQKHCDKYLSHLQKFQQK